MTTRSAALLLTVFASIPFLCAQELRSAAAAQAPAASSVFAPQQPPQPAPLQPGQTADPFPQPIEARQGVITVGVREFASVPDIDGVAARMMNLVNESG